LLETILGPLLLVGLFTRPVAVVLSGLSAFAYFMVHAPQSFWPTANGGEGAILYCFLFLYFAAVGGGKWSLDALRQRTSLST
jgi:putative oxidoreductase